jgi:hypothetical protein
MSAAGYAARLRQSASAVTRLSDRSNAERGCAAVFLRHSPRSLGGALHAGTTDAPAGVISFNPRPQTARIVHETWPAKLDLFRLSHRFIHPASFR